MHVGDILKFLSFVIKLSQMSEAIWFTQKYCLR